MAISQLRSRRKPSGARYKKIVKKLRNKGNLPTLTGIGKLRKTAAKTRGGHIKQRILKTDIANIYDPKLKKYFKSKIESVIDAPSNRNFVRRNIMTKGTIIKTEKGNAKITSRPGQEGTVNAILV
ncbi:MAG: 30S ribosomal protein S8e [Nanoarchaeota archaeon]|mgnify:CR=1 FL=1